MWQSVSIDGSWFSGVEASGEALGELRNGAVVGSLELRLGGEVLVRLRAQRGLRGDAAQRLAG